MYKLLLASPLLVFLLSAGAPADEQSAARAILEKAIKAKGDEAALAKIVAVHCKFDAKSFVNGRTIPVQIEMYDQGCDKTRTMFADDRGKVIEVANGKAGWVKEGDNATKAMTEAELASSLEGTYVGWIRLLVPLRNADYRLSPLDETTIDGHKAVGILVRHDKLDAVKLYFDKETYLMSKVEVRHMDAHTEKESLVALVFSDHRTVHGIKQPFKREWYRDGDKKTEAVCTLVEFSEKPLDEKLFSKP